MTTRVWGVSVGVPYYGSKKCCLAHQTRGGVKVGVLWGTACVKHIRTHTHTPNWDAACASVELQLSGFFSNSLSSLSRFSLKHQHDTRLTPWSECQDLATHAFCHALVCWFKQKVRRGFPHPTTGLATRNSMLRVASDIYSMNCIYWS